MSGEPGTTTPARITRIRSGGQAGVDRAALDAAIDHDIPYIGWVPKGGVAEDYRNGGLCHVYPHLTEMSTSSYPARTAANVRDADATLILAGEKMGRGTALTLREAQRQDKPALVVPLAGDPDQAAQVIADWLDDHFAGRDVELNVAGPRASAEPTADARTYNTVQALLLLRGAR